MEKTQELKNCFIEYCEAIQKSWTFGKMTESERKTCLETLCWANTQGMIKGNYVARYQIMNAIYHAFLMGLGYTDFNWRTNYVLPSIIQN